MAEEKKSGGAGQDALLFFGILLLLVVVWIARGGASAADLKGMFVHPPAPVGQGGAYGPTINNFPATTSQEYTR